MTTGRFNGVGGWKVDVYRGRSISLIVTTITTITTNTTHYHTTGYGSQHWYWVFQVLEARTLFCHRTPEDIAAWAPPQRGNISERKNQIEFTFWFQHGKYSSQNSPSIRIRNIFNICDQSEQWSELKRVCQGPPYVWSSIIPLWTDPVFVYLYLCICICMFVFVYLDCVFVLASLNLCICKGSRGGLPLDLQSFSFGRIPGRLCYLGCFESWTGS